MIGRVAPKLAIAGLFVFLASGALGGVCATEPPRDVSESDFEIIAANTDYAFWGKVLTFKADDRHHALLRVEVQGELHGHLGEREVEVTAGGYGLGGSNPREYLQGSEYLFLCFRQFEGATVSYLPGLLCYSGGILCRDTVGENIVHCAGVKKFAVDDPLAALQRALEKLTIPQLAEESDLVVLAGDVDIKEPTSSTERAVIGVRDVGIARVSAVVKGKCEAAMIEFSIERDNEIYTAPIIERQGVAVLFLRGGESGYTLVRNERGLCTLSGDRVVTNKGIYTGYRLVGNAFTKDE